jgi:hypothetical protein
MRQAMMATLVANRLRILLPKLQTRYEQVHEQEQAAAWRAERVAAWLAEHDVVRRERDALAKELCEVYPDAATKIADLFVRIAVNNEALAQLHRARPAGVEQHLTSVFLFDWDTGHQVWPPPRPSMASAFAATAMPACDRRFTADWAKDNERRAAGQQAQQQRIADYYARTTKEQEDRENAEARERFLAQQQRLTVNRPPRP